MLEIKKLAGVQWVYGAGQPSAKYWIPTLKKIQGANKRIQVHCEKDDLATLCEALDPEGVHLICYASDEDEARSMLKMMERIYKNKRSYMC